jgi:hypothetical protein
MIICNVEGDEILMSICMKVKKTKYWAVFPKGTRYHLTERYRVNGRFSRKSVELYFAKKKLVLDENYTIEVTEDYEGKEELALFLIKKQIRKLYAMTNADVINFWLGPSSTDTPNFRFKSAVTQPYKSDRAEKPAIREMLREWLIQTQGAQIAHGHEADDMLGIHQKNEFTVRDDFNEFGEFVGGSLSSGTIACHVDKDICQIPGWHYNTDSDSLYYVTDPGELTLSNDRSSLKGKGIAFFYAQMLMGDRTDTIPSLKSGKYGAVGVYNLLQDCKEEYDYVTIIVEEFQKVMGDKWRDRLYEQADLVFICRKQGETGSVYIHNKLLEYGI